MAPKSSSTAASMVAVPAGFKSMQPTKPQPCSTAMARCNSQHGLTTNFSIKILQHHRAKYSKHRLMLKPMVCQQVQPGLVSDFVMHPATISRLIPSDTNPVPPTGIITKPQKSQHPLEPQPCMSVEPSAPMQVATDTSTASVSWMSPHKLARRLSSPINRIHRCSPTADLKTALLTGLKTTHNCRPLMSTKAPKPSNSQQQPTTNRHGIDKLHYPVKSILHLSWQPALISPLQLAWDCDSAMRV